MNILMIRWIQTNITMNDIIHISKKLNVIDGKRINLIGILQQKQIE
jgi:hypothetical protein